MYTVISSNTKWIH